MSRRALTDESERGPRASRRHRLSDACTACRRTCPAAGAPCCAVSDASSFLLCVCVRASFPVEQKSQLINREFSKLRRAANPAAKKVAAKTAKK